MKILKLKYRGDYITAIREKYQKQIEDALDLKRTMPNSQEYLSQIEPEYAHFLRNATIETIMETASVMKKRWTDEEIAETTHLPLEIIKLL